MKRIFIPNQLISLMPSVTYLLGLGKMFEGDFQTHAPKMFACVDGWSSDPVNCVQTGSKTPINTSGNISLCQGAAFNGTVLTECTYCNFHSQTSILMQLEGHLVISFAHCFKCYDELK